MFTRPMIRTTWPLAVVLALLVGATGCDQSTTTPDAPPLGAAAVDDLTDVTEEEARAWGWMWNYWHPFHRRTPDAALDQLVQAYNERNIRRMQPLLGGRFLFHTSDTPGVPETLSRRETMRALQRMFEDPSVTSVSLALEYDAQDGPAHPRWATIDVTSVELQVVKVSEFGGDLTFVVRGDPARFVLGRGPSILKRWGGWQLMAQHDLHGQTPPGEARIEVESSWTELLRPYLEEDEGDGGGGL